MGFRVQTSACLVVLVRKKEILNQNSSRLDSDLGFPTVYHPLLLEEPSGRRITGDLSQVKMTWN